MRVLSVCCALLSLANSSGIVVGSQVRRFRTFVYLGPFVVCYRRYAVMRASHLDRRRGGTKKRTNIARISTAAIFGRGGTGMTSLFCLVQAYYYSVWKESIFK